MKHEQVVPDYIVMLESSMTVLALVGCGWLLFKLVSACFWFPQYMKTLEVEADKAHKHLEASLLTKLAAEEPEEPETSESEIKSPDAEKAQGLQDENDESLQDMEEEADTKKDK